MCPRSCFDKRWSLSSAHVDMDCTAFLDGASTYRSTSMMRLSNSGMTCGAAFAGVAQRVVAVGVWNGSVVDAVSA